MAARSEPEPVPASLRVAFVGLGAMGLPMAERLAAAGHDVRGFDLSERPRAPLEAAGGRFAASAADAAGGADALIAMTVTGAQALAVYREAAEALPPSALVIACCTQSRADAAAMGETVTAGGHRFVDAPVSGGAKGAASGTLSIMGSGPPDAWDAARPLLEAMGDKVHRMGEAWGLGSLAKTINQHLAGVHIAAAAEALALGARAGLDGQAMLDLYGGSAAASWMLADRGPRMLEADPAATSAVDIFVKDLGIVLEAGAALGDAPVPLARAALALFREASERGWGGADDSQVIRVLRDPDA